MQDILKFIHANKIEVLVRQGSPNTYAEVLKEIKSAEIFNIIVNTKPEHLRYFLRAVCPI